MSQFVQSTVKANIQPNREVQQVSMADGPNLDAFSRVRVSNTETIFALQHQYSQAGMQIERGNTGTGVLPAHIANTRMMQLSATAGSGTSWIQSFMYCPYQPGRSQFIALTGVIGAGVTGAVVDWGYFDLLNGAFLRQNGTSGLQVVIRSNTSGSPVERVVNQADWNVDKFDGTGKSGITLDITKAQILIIDLQFLGMGRVRFGFDINGSIYYVHQFLNANNLDVPYMQSATLPVQMLLTATSSSGTKTCYSKCYSVTSEGGNLDMVGYMHATPDQVVTAGSGTATPLISIRPKTTYNGIINRQYTEVIDLIMIATGANPVYWELVTGGTYTGQAWSDVNTNFSGTEYASTPGTVSSLTGTVRVACGYISGAGVGTSSPTVTPIVIPPKIGLKFPLTLDRAGNQRANGTYTLLVYGIGGTSAVHGVVNFKEIR